MLEAPKKQRKSLKGAIKLLERCGASTAAALHSTAAAATLYIDWNANPTSLSQGTERKVQRV